MFGDCIKVRIHEDKPQSHEDTNNSNFKNLARNLIKFLAKELGCSEKMFDIVNFNPAKNKITLKIPDAGYEILMSWLN